VIRIGSRWVLAHAHAHLPDFDAHPVGDVEHQPAMEHLYPYPKMGNSFLEILHDPLTRKLLGFDAVHAEPTPFISGVTSRLKFLLQDATQQLSFLKIGYTALEAFLQANCTGPPLEFDTEEVTFPETYRQQDDLKALKDEIFEALAVDGSRPYPLTPHIELFWLAKVVLSQPPLAEAGFNGRRGRMRLNFWHQKLLSEESPSLRDILYADAEVLEQQLFSRLAFGGAAAEEHFVEFLVERAVMRTYYGEDVLARADLARAAKTRDFQFVLTGALGKRTKFQEKDISQLVVLAKSRDHEPEPYSSRKNSRVDGMETPRGDGATASPSSYTPRRPSSPARLIPHHEHSMSPLANTPTQPENVLLNDDTLLERITFKPDQTLDISEQTMTQVAPSPSSPSLSSTELPPALAALDPANQPLLFPMDSIILLATASSITNTSPADGLVREETLPYATRVLDGGSSNWQVYTQALLVRSRIEGYKARTAERGLLQLQALVDQVIAETSQQSQPASSSPPDEKTSSDPRRDVSKPPSNATSTQQSSSVPGTFLPRPTAAESATVPERLRYIPQISPPLRWELEAELAQRWTSMGGLKTALDIYERLHMHAEVALCLAATDQEAQAIALLKSLLFAEPDQGTTPTTSTGKQPPPAGQETLKRPSPPDAPRLLCILGDMIASPAYYTLSWTVSSQRYSRAQRSLGRHFTKQRQFAQAAEAYRLALGISRLDRASWFSLGCVQLELEAWRDAVQSFTRCVQLEDQDAEAWSNLAVALLRLPVPASATTVPETAAVQEEADSDVPPPPSTAQDPETSTDATPATAQATPGDSDSGSVSTTKPPQSIEPYKNTLFALRALRHAARLKREDARIWDNYLTVAASIPPSTGQTPWNEIIQAMGRVVELRAKKEGEACVDIKILSALAGYVMDTWRYPDAGAEDDGEADVNVSTTTTAATEREGGGQDGSRAFTNHDAHSSAGDVDKTHANGNDTSSTTRTRLPHLPRSFLHLLDTQIAPLLTSSSALATLLSNISLWRHRPLSALTFAEKSWRLTLTRISPAETFDEVPPAQWAEVAEKTVWLMQRYESLGPMQRERTGGEVEAKWRFKAKSAARKLLGRAKTWEDRSDGRKSWELLKGKMDEL
jgi:tetratricopeptide (TPR) repeat protein